MFTKMRYLGAHWDLFSACDKVYLGEVLRTFFEKYRRIRKCDMILHTFVFFLLSACGRANVFFHAYLGSWNIHKNYTFLCAAGFVRAPGEDEPSLSRLV